LQQTQVAMPWEDFSRLLAASRKEEKQPPVPSVFGSVQCQVKVNSNRALTTTTAALTVLSDDWTLVPLGSATRGVVAVKLDGEDCPLVSRAGKNFAMIKGAGKHTLRIVSQFAPATVGGKTNLALPLLPAPIVQVEMHIPAAGLAVQAKGLTGLKQTTKDGETVVTGTAAGDSVHFTWYRRPREAPKRQAKVYAQTGTLVSVGRQRFHVRAVVRYDIRYAPVDRLSVALPSNAEFVEARVDGLYEVQRQAGDKHETITAILRAPVRDTVELVLRYDVRLADGKAVSIPLVTPQGVEQEGGCVGIEVTTGAEVTPSVEGMERIDVSELPRRLWRQASSPVIYAWEYDKSDAARLAVKVVRHKDVDVLVAMSDICEATTTVTPDGKSITKLMYITRNNLKQFMRVDLPVDAEIWSVFVDDHPVTPVRNKAGQLLIPLRQSQPENEFDEDDPYDPDARLSYRQRRARRRKGEDLERAYKIREERLKERVRDVPPPDLKPYDVEIVYVTTGVALGERGELQMALPKIDIPVGRMAWAVILPDSIRVVDVTGGNMKEVDRFGLPFAHFAEAGRDRSVESSKAMQMQEMAQAKMAQDEMLAADAKAEGVLPVRVEIPLTGELYRFSKMLVVDEAPNVTLLCRRPRR
jgi:hypothetical protein